MNKTESMIRRAFADAEELVIEHDKEGVLNLKGIVVVEGISFRISVKRNDSGNVEVTHGVSPPKYKYLYAGTVSTLDPSTTKVMLSEKKRRAKEEKGISYKDKDIYSTAKIRCDSVDPQKLANAILERITALIQQDKSQLDQAILRAMTPDQLSLPFAAEQYAADFLRRAYPRSAPDENAKRLAKLQRTLSKFPATPIAKLGKRQVNAILHEIHATEESIKLSFLFVDYLIQMRKCSGANPFTMPGSKKPSGKNALAQQELGDAVFDKLFVLLNKQLSPISVAIALAASGFPLTDIKGMSWSDLEIMHGYKDYVVAHIQRDYASVSKHDFSRPVIPDAALLIRRLIRERKKQTPAEELAKQSVWPNGLDNKAVNNEIRNLLVRAGFDGKLSAAGRPREDDVDIPAGILQTNYKRMLYVKAGLKDDPDTLNFLCGTLFKSSTFTSYESHTGASSMLRLYQYLKPLSTEKRLGKSSGYRSESDKMIYEAWPQTNHEAAHLGGFVQLRPGDQIILCSPHGVNGIIRLHRDGSDLGVEMLKK